LSSGIRSGREEWIAGKRPKPGHRAERGEKTRLGEQLTHDLPAAGADRHAHGHLVGAGRGASEQQVGDVGAGDEQHERRDAKQQHQRRLRFRTRRALPLRAPNDAHRLRLELHLGLVAHPLLERRLDLGDDRVIGDVGGGPGLLHRDAGLQPREEIRPVGLALVEALEAGLHLSAQRDRDEHARLHPERRAVEARRGHAHDRHALAVDGDRFVEDVGIESEPRLPIVVAQDDDVRFADDAIVLGPEQAAKRGADAEHREVAARDEHALAVEGLLAPVGEVRVEDAVRGDAAERHVGVLQVAEHRIAEHLVAAAGVAARVAPRLGPRRGQVDQPIGRLHRQRAQQHLVEQRVDGRVGADPECQGQDGDGGDERRARQCPKCELQVAHARV
jgi:hypothetical protein